jgi:hypothetical protein
MNPQSECLRACLKMVASAILADVEPVRPARRKQRLLAINLVKSGVSGRRTVFPDGKMPTSTAGGTPAATFSDRLSGKTDGLVAPTSKEGGW